MTLPPARKRKFRKVRELRGLRAALTAKINQSCENTVTIPIRTAQALQDVCDQLIYLGQHPEGTFR